jgi:SAM-dependent methyltransferase
MKINKCPCCGSRSLKLSLALKATPLGDKYSISTNNYKAMPLDLVECGECHLAFLDEFVTPEESYDDYAYVSSSTVGLDLEYENYSTQLLQVAPKRKNLNILEIGSNDGLFLSNFIKYGHEVTGIEPSLNAHLNAIANGVNSINSYFTSDYAHNLVESGKKFDLVIANYVFANLPDLNDVIEGMKFLLRDEGLISVQTGYHPIQFDYGMFDYIYHEHYFYFTLKSLEEIFTKHGFHIVDAILTSSKISSIRITMSLTKPKTESCTLEFIRRLEKIIFSESNLIKDTEKKISEVEHKLSTFIELIGSTTKIYGYGASHSVTTLLYQFPCLKNINALLDDNKIKQGRLSPGLNIPVIDPRLLREDKEAVVIITAWQHQISILKNIATLRRGCVNKCICVIPFPVFRIEVL